MNKKKTYRERLQKLEQLFCATLCEDPLDNTSFDKEVLQTLQYLKDKYTDKNAILFSTNKPDREIVQEEFLNDGIKLKTPIVELTELFIPKHLRGQGHGTKIVKDLLKKTKGSVILNAYPIDKDYNLRKLEEQRNKLVKWYKSLGFKHVCGGWMYYTRVEQ